MQQAPSGAMPIVHQAIAPAFQDTPMGIPDTQVITTNGGVQFSDAQAQAQFEADKRAVYRHPLFPLLALLFEKCELATQSAECPSSEGFDIDLQAFVQHQEQDRKPFFSDDPEVDGLMVKAIQVLRIHLLELEKVQELCKDFCNRYITCLKGKMQSENLLRSDYPSYTGSSSASSGSDSDSRHSVPPSTTTQTVQAQAVQPVQVMGSAGAVNNVVIQPTSVSAGVSMAAIQPGQIVSGGTVYQMVQTPQGIVAQPIQIQTTQMQTPLTAQHIIHGSTPLSQIGVSSSAISQDRPILPADPSTPTSQDEDDDLMSKKKQKRGILPKHATSIMRSWLFQHIVHPYPTEDEKRQIAAQTNLTLLQVNNWFINARRRILQPMLDASNPDSSHKSKKAKTQSSRPLQRFWPDNIANLQPRLPGHTSHSQSSEQHSPGGSSGEEKSVNLAKENGISSVSEKDACELQMSVEDVSQGNASSIQDLNSPSELSLDNSDSSNLGDD